MRESRQSTILLDKKFTDFDELSYDVNSWDLDLKQLDRGEFWEVSFKPHFGKVLFTEAQFGRKLEQRGTSPTGLRTLAIPADRSVSFNWRNHKVSENDVLIFPQHGDWGSFSDANFHVFIISLPESLLQSAIESTQILNANRVLESETISCAPDKIDQLRCSLQRIVNATRGSTRTECNLMRMESNLTRLFTDLLRFPTEASQPTVRHHRERLVECATRLIAMSDNLALSVADICSKLRVSERTLQYAFSDYVGVSPKSYIQAVRLNGVRRDLKNALHGSSVSELAMKWDFWHMSQFAADYRKYFCELPSQTLGKARR